MYCYQLYLYNGRWIMGIGLQIGLFIASFISLLVVLMNVVKNKMNIHYAMIWIIWGISMVVISIFPQIIFTISEFLSIQVPVNAVFLIMIFLLYCLSFYIYLKLSKQTEQIINLNYEVAVLKKRLEEIEKKDE